MAASIGVLLASSLISVLTAVPPAQALTVPTDQKDCVAAGGSWVPMEPNEPADTCQIILANTFTPDEEAQSYSYYVALGGCIQNNMYGDFPTTITGNGNSPPSEWFDDNTATGFVYPGGTKTDCKDIATEALTLWGWTGSTESFLTAMGYTFHANTDTGQPTYDGTSDGSTRIKNVQTAVQAQVYGGSAPSLSGAATYDVDFNAFTMNGGTCSASDLGPYSSLGSTEKKYAVAPPGTVVDTSPPGRSKTTVTYVKLPVIDPTTGASVDHGYTYTYTIEATGAPSDADTVTLYGYHATAKTASCEQLAAGISKNAAAYAKVIKQGTADTGASQTCKENPTAPGCPGTPAANTCNIPSLGWILCPVLTTGANIADSAYGFLADNFLSTDPSLVGTDPNAQVTNPDGSTSKVGDGTFVAWGIMRNIANVAFIIVFLIVIFSQLSSVGVSNFGVKKLLPRLIIGAVLVNASFYICQIAVDLSNILGYSLKDLFQGIATQIQTATASGTSTADESGNLGGIVTLVLASATLIWINIGALIVALVGAIVALLVIFVLLVARKALIILLIAVAPLAFVAYLLPNTEQYFHKWRKALTSLLLLFPVIGVLMGACALASAILLSVAPGAGTDSSGTDSPVTIMKIAAYMVLVIPLVAAIPLLKGSLDGIGKIGGAIQGLGQKVGGASKAKTQKTYDNSRLGQLKKYREGQWDQRRARIQSGTYRAKGGKANPLNWLSAGNRSMNRVSGRFGSRLTATGDALANTEDTELLGNADARVGSMSFTGADGVTRPLSTAQLIQMAKKQDITDTSGNVLARAGQFDEYARRASIKRAAAVANVNEANQLLDASSGMSKLERKTLTKGLRTAGVTSRAPWLSGTTLAAVEQGGITAEAATMQAVQDGKVTAEALAAGDDASTAHLLSTLSDKPADNAATLARKATLRAMVKGEADKIYAAGSHLDEKVTAGSGQEANVGTMRSW